MFRKVIIGSLAALAFSGSLAQAAFIDFTSSAVTSQITSNPATFSIGAGDGLNSALSVTVGVTGGSAKFQNFDGGNGSYCQNNGPFACDIDGIGIGDDEITGTNKRHESVSISFDRSVWIDELFFLDIFKGRNSSKSGERATVDLFDSNDVLTSTLTLGFFNSDDLDATGATFGAGEDISTGSGGFLAFQTQDGSFADRVIQAQKLVFTALKISGDNGNNDYAVAGLSVADVTPVPVPAALPLMLAGLAGFGLLARRKKRAANA